jgi:OHCU decarboxylase
LTTALERLNALSREAAAAELLKCCGSQNWARRTADERPFDDLTQLLETADRIWWTLDRADWLEAFRHHPKIGEKRAAERSVTAAARRWSEEEQSGTRAAAPQTMDALLAANRVYEQKFGYIFIVCATGKSTEEMLALLGARLGNDAGTELRIAAEEQRRITHLRLEKLLSQ